MRGPSQRLFQLEPDVLSYETRNEKQKQVTSISFSVFEQAMNGETANYILLSFTTRETGRGLIAVL